MNSIDAIAPDAPPASPDNFTSCFGSEFPVGAAVVKAQWRRAEFGMKLPTFDTSPEALAQRWDAGADWGAPLPTEGSDDPGADRIHTVRLSNGNVFRLVGLHVITKELRKWLWVTMWWSPDGDGDFGADRPADLEADPIFRHYKMCVVSGARRARSVAAAGADLVHQSVSRARRRQRAHQLHRLPSARRHVAPARDHHRRRDALSRQRAHGAARELSDRLLVGAHARGQPRAHRRR